MMRKRIYGKRNKIEKEQNNEKKSQVVLNQVWRGENVGEERKSFVTRWWYPRGGNMVAFVGAECEVGLWVDRQVC